MFGVRIEKGIMDWQIIQHEDGFGQIRLSGSYQVPKAAIEVGVEKTNPIVRVLSEDDNSQIIPWTTVISHPCEDGLSGTWEMELKVPAGGLYRIETGLDTKSTKPDLGWIFRGDVRLHVGVGDLFIVAGQSNSSGYGKDAALDSPSLDVHLYRNRGTWDLACHPINESSFTKEGPNIEMGVSGVSPYISFGKAFHQLSHYPVGLITTALGGSPISRWDKAQNGDLYRNMIGKVKECGNKAAGILWYQGCSDTTPSQAAIYYESFQHLVADTRAELGYQIPLFTFQLNRQINGLHDECWGIVREVQRKAALEMEAVYVLPTINCPLSDGIHNNAHSNMMLGEKMAKLCGNVLYGTPEYSSPDIAEAVLTEKVLKVTFRNMKRGFIIISGLPKDSGFMVKDARGEVPIQEYKTSREKPNELTFMLERIPEGQATISFAWEANPVMIPLLDEVTYMPPLSFYEFPIDRI